MYRKDYPILSKKINNKNLIYFDSACTYLANVYAIKGSQIYDYEYSCCGGDRGASYLGSLLSEDVEKTRGIIKQFIGANSTDAIVFTSSASEGINILLHSLDSDMFHTCIVSDIEHNSNFLPQYEFSRKNNSNFIVFPYSYFLDLDILEQKISGITPGFLVSITHSSNITGKIFNIKKISSIVHKYGGYILVDSTQYIVHTQENVLENSIDFLVFSGHKLGGPTGIGILYISESAKELIDIPGKVGGGTLSSLSRNGKVEYKSLPNRLEAGVQNFSGILGLRGIIEYYNDKKYSEIHLHITDLVKYFWEKFDNFNLRNYFTVVNSSNSFIVTLIPKSFNSIEFQQFCNYFLDDYIISFRTGTMCADNFTQIYYSGNINFMRLSFGIYNSKDEIDIFFNSVVYYITELK